MKYRIKIITYQNGRKGYFAQYKTKVGWMGLWWDGSVDYFTGANSADSRKDALARIDNHYGGNTKKQTIEFEYIDK